MVRFSKQSIQIIAGGFLAAQFCKKDENMNYVVTEVPYSKVKSYVESQGLTWEHERKTLISNFRGTLEGDGSVFKLVAGCQPADLLEDVNRFRGKAKLHDLQLVDLNEILTETEAPATRGEREV